MNVLIRPAAALMSRLRFRSKFILSGIVAGALLLWLGVSAVSKLHDRVQMIESERAAVAIMGTLVEWNKVLIENRRIVITTAPGDNTEGRAAIIAAISRRKNATMAASVPMCSATSNARPKSAGTSHPKKARARMR